MKIAAWNVEIRYVIKCAYCGKFTEASDTCKTASEAVKECMEYGDVLEHSGVMCSRCRYEANKSAYVRGKYQVIRFGDYEEWRLALSDGSFGPCIIVNNGEYPKCAGCSEMWPEADLTPGFPICPDCLQSEKREAERLQEERNKGEYHVYGQN